MRTWEDKLDEFLVPWRKTPELIGVLACGSFVTGNPNPNSDLDVHLLLSESVDWRKRGNRIIDGLLIEYFANPPRQIRTYFTENYESHSMMTMTQFITGRILFDATGELAVLREEARTWAAKPLPAQPEWKTESDKYGIWDTGDNLADAAKRGAPDLPFLYFTGLHKLFVCYARYLGYAAPSPCNIHRILTAEAVRLKYRQPEFPDSDFAEAFAEAMAETDRQAMPDRFRHLALMVLRAMNGFEIDGWSLRTPSV
jgi:hypothetical protein